MTHPFHWVPACGRRHATLDERPGGGYPTGLLVHTLCGAEIPAENTESAWFWRTCADCAPEARRIAERRVAEPKRLFG